MKQLEDLYELKWIEMNLVAKEVEMITSFDKTYIKNSTNIFSLSASMLNYYREQIEDGEGKLVLNEIITQGNDAEITKIYVDAVEKKAEYTSLYIYNRNFEKEDTVAYICNNKSIIALKNAEEDYVNKVIMYETSDEEIHTSITMLMDNFINSTGGKEIL